jgi:ribosomal protein S18 acetylase RimI-like enzyme
MTADASMIADVHDASARDAYAGIKPDDGSGQSTLGARTEMWTSVLNASRPPGEQRLHVAEEAGAIVGFGSCGVQRTPALVSSGYESEIWCVYVLPSHQRRGIGSALMRRMADDLQDRGLRGMAVWVVQQNRPATRFYERLGGKLVADKEERIGSSVLREVAYGWRHLSRIQDAAA